MNYKQQLLSLLLFFIFKVTTSQSVSFQQIDSAIGKSKTISSNDSLYISTCFFIADQYMSFDMYDSAQIWLNNIASRLPRKKPSLSNFYLCVNQAETYYYNGLKLLGLKESERILFIAHALDDSICLATGYNMVGVFFLSMDSIERSIPYFIKGIRYARQPPYPPQYLSASKPHHLFGNLAEAMYKLGKYDSARRCAEKALAFATEIPWPRGMAVANNLLGLISAKENLIAMAITFQLNAVGIGLTKNQPDVALIAYGALANCYTMLGKKDSAMQFIQKGYALMSDIPTINTLFIGQFLDETIVISRTLKQQQWVEKGLEMKADLLKHLIRKNDHQITGIVAASVQNETDALNLELEKAKQQQELANTRLLFAVIALASMLLLFLIYRYYQKKQLDELAIRNQISRDLHDDIGATLSSIKIYSELAHEIHETHPEKSRSMLQHIKKQALESMSAMGDVIWSMKATAPDQTPFAAKITNYAASLLGAKGIAFTIDVDNDLMKQINNPVVLKNLLLIVKEAINNISKYSNAGQCNILLKKQVKEIILKITDDGNGFDITQTTGGNGLHNMKQRCTQIKGSFEMRTAPGTGVTLAFTFPLHIAI